MTVATIGTLAFAGSRIVSAANYGKGNGEELAQQVASKLNVSEDKVQNAFDEIHSERQQQMQNERKAELDKAVTDGVITQEQEDALIAKQSEIREKEQQLRGEMDQWMSDNGIDESALHKYMGGSHGYGHGNN